MSADAVGGSARRVVFVGLGKMGENLSRHVRGALPGGMEMAVFDIDRRRTEEVAGTLQASPLGSVAGIRAGDLVCLSVPDGAVVASLVGDLEAAGALAGTRILDFSSVSPHEATAFADRCAAAGGAYHDCPVTGGVVGARAGTLTTIVGGSDQLPEASLWPIQAFSKHVVRAGRVGSGALMKTLSNMVGNVAAIVSMEAIIIAKRAGVSDEVVLDLFNNGPARSYYSEVRYPNYVLTGTFDAGMRLGLVLKDLAIAMEAATKFGVSPSVCESGVAAWSRALDEQGADADTTRAIVSVTRAIAGTTWESLARKGADPSRT